MLGCLRYLSEIYKDRPGSQTIHAFNRSLCKAGVVAVKHHPNAYVTNVARYFDEKGYHHLFVSGGVETVTFRYFESIASKCLIVGCCPQELKDIFGYNPVIEINASDCGEQLINILSNIGNYQDLVNKNHQQMLEVGTWDVRVQSILALLKQREYVVEAS